MGTPCSLSCVRIVVLWAVVLYSLVDGYQVFGGTLFLRFQGRRPSTTRSALCQNPEGHNMRRDVFL